MLLWPFPLFKKIKRKKFQNLDNKINSKYVSNIIYHKRTIYFNKYFIIEYPKNINAIDITIIVFIPSAIAR